MVQQENVHIESNCHNCPMRARAEARPQLLLSRLWRWHTRWCPGWKAYLTELQGKGIELPRA